MTESPGLKESTIRREIELAKTDVHVRALLDAMYMDEDRETSFQRYCASREFEIFLAEISRHAPNKETARICEIGAGTGFLAVALARSGFRNVTILEPNSEWTSGTGFIADKARMAGVRIWNDLDAWYDCADTYDLIVTRACVHHFDNVSKVAAEIRCKIAEDGKWLMFDEFFASSAKEVYAALAEHAHAVKYSQYEWPYSASLYVDLLRLVGYRLVEVLPNRYENNVLVHNQLPRIKLTKTATVLTRLLLRARLTALAFELESFVDRYFGLDRRLRMFTMPQLLVFRSERVPLPPLPPPP